MYKIVIEASSPRELIKDFEELRSLINTDGMRQSLTVSDDIKAVKEFVGDGLLAKPYEEPAIEDTRQAPVTDIGEVDVRGVPWIKGAHADNKSKTKNGRWKKRKGADEAELAAAEAPYIGKQQQIAAVIPAPPVVPAPPAQAAGQTEPAPAGFPQLMAEAQLRNISVSEINAKLAEISGGELSSVALAIGKPIYIDALYDWVRADAPGA